MPLVPPPTFHALGFPAWFRCGHLVKKFFPLLCVCFGTPQITFLAAYLFSFCFHTWWSFLSRIFFFWRPSTSSEVHRWIPASPIRLMTFCVSCASFFFVLYLRPSARWQFFVSPLPCPNGLPFVCPLAFPVRHAGIAPYPALGCVVSSNGFLSASFSPRHPYSALQPQEPCSFSFSLLFFACVFGYGDFQTRVVNPFSVFWYSRDLYISLIVFPSIQTRASLWPFS